MMLSRTTKEFLEEESSRTKEFLSSRCAGAGEVLMRSLMSGRTKRRPNKGTAEQRDGRQGQVLINATGEIVSLTEHRHEREYAEKHPPECPVSMKHAMKMVVPFNTVAKPRVDVNRFTDKVDIEGKDSEVEDEKDKLYSSSSFSNIIPTVDVEDKAGKDKDNCNIELLVLDTVPKRCKSQAAKILSYIKKHSDITWSPKGELTLKGSVLPNTHMVDLINAMLRKRISKPSGWKQFATVLKDTKIPHKLVR